MYKNLLNDKKFIPAGTFLAGVDIGKGRNYFQGITSTGEFATHKACSFENNRSGMDEFLARTKIWMKEGLCDKIIVGMEPTGSYWIPFASYLEENGIPVALVNPYHVKKSKELYDNSPKKSDSKDALLIARMMREGKYLRHVCLSNVQEEIKESLDFHAILTKEKVALKNQIRNKLAEYFPELEGIFKKIDGKTVIGLLKLYPLPCDVINQGEEYLGCFLRKKSRGRFKLRVAKGLLNAAIMSVGKKKGLEIAHWVISRLASKLEEIIAEIKVVESRMKTLMEGMGQYHILKSIPNVSTITIAAVTSAVGDMNRFSCAGEVLKLLGLNIYEVSSGKHKGQRHITKRGNSRARAKLYEIIVSCCKKNGIFREKYDNMTKRGKPAPKVYVALVCKMIRIMFVLIKTGKFFDRDLMYGKAEKIDSPQISMIAA